MLGSRVQCRYGNELVKRTLIRRMRSIARLHGGQMSSRIGTQTNMNAMTRTVMMTQRVSSDMAPSSGLACEAIGG
jgi:hypothetical protein